MNKTPIYTTRTFMVAIASMVAAAGTYMAGEIGLGPALQTITMALLGIFIRDGVSKETTP